VDQERWGVDDATSDEHVWSLVNLLHSAVAATEELWQASWRDGGVTLQATEVHSMARQVFELSLLLDDVLESVRDPAAVERIHSAVDILDVTLRRIQAATFDVD